MKIWIASDYTHGRYLEIPDEHMTPVDIAYKYGRAEGGEIVHIWFDGDVGRLPDAIVYWDSYHRKYQRQTQIG